MIETRHATPAFIAGIPSIAGKMSLVLVAIALFFGSQSSALASSQVKAVVNNIAITSSDVSRRINFLRLRRVKGNLAERAREELINEILERDEIVRTGSSISAEQVEGAYSRFATSNKLTTEQLTKLLGQAGIGADHFKAYLGISMSWPRVVNARYGASGKITTQDMVTRIKANNGKKPTTTEFTIQQVIFVVPQSKRGKITGKRKSEAEASRAKYPGCKDARAFAATMRDVSIRDLGRVMLPELPSEWKDAIVATAEGGTTKTQVTDKGVEYLAICKKREVSDDLAAQVVFQAQDLEKAAAENENPNSKKYILELRKKAQIIVN